MRNFFEETYMNIDFKRELIQLISEISEYTGSCPFTNHKTPDTK